MALEKVKLNRLEQWVQNLPTGYDGVRVLADFFAHDIVKYDDSAMMDLLESIISGGWFQGVKMMVDNMTEEETEAYYNARIFAERYYGTDKPRLETSSKNDNEEKLDSAIETVMQEFFLQLFKPNDAAINI